jgi:hypothetical protein
MSEVIAFHSDIVQQRPQDIQNIVNAPYHSFIIFFNIKQVFSVLRHMPYQREKPLKHCVVVGTLFWNSL